MGSKILVMYITMTSVILSGIINMIFVKTPVYKKHNMPIDRGRNFLDGKRWLGDNKTYIGFLSMIIINGCVQVILGMIPSIEQWSEFYRNRVNTVGFNLFVGFILGFTYMIFELPNSFIKRRLDIIPGKTDKGIKGMIFFLVDQFDSILGVILVLAIVSGISFREYVEYVLLGGFTHVVINLFLYILKIRKNL